MFGSWLGGSVGLRVDSQRGSMIRLSGCWLVVVFERAVGG